MSEQTPDPSVDEPQDAGELEDQDAGPASRPTGAAAQESPTDDPDAGPASAAPPE